MLATCGAAADVPKKFGKLALLAHAATVLLALLHNLDSVMNLVFNARRPGGYQTTTSREFFLAHETLDAQGLTLVSRFYRRKGTLASVINEIFVSEGPAVSNIKIIKSLREKRTPGRATCAKPGFLILIQPTPVRTALNLPPSY